MNLRRKGRLTDSILAQIGSCILSELEQSGSLLGYRSMWHLLRTKYKVCAPRRVVRELLSVVDPRSVEIRRRGRLHRRIYRSKGPNHCWHIDGNDKLKPFGFHIHGGIDGYSRKILWLEVASTNKDSFVIGGYYLKAVELCEGCPTLVRADMGTENAKVAHLQPFLRRHDTDSFAGCDSFRYGKSVHNQRIEAMWSVLRKWCLDWWIDFFKRLREEGHYDGSDPIQVDCMTFAFMDLIQSELDNVVQMWNTHLIRRSTAETVNGIPNELYHIPEIRGVQDCKHMYDEEDLELCREYTSDKPPVRQEFLEVAEILLEENNWSAPTDIIYILIFIMQLINGKFKM
ncbi:uncharacterized protein LOC135337880 [Halichondria panicea]|uniref:uncharacterized protein LOC135337880 n=1 Tax=Halichondria panicea TaxID=6063 RepID=UPI00312B334A